MVEKFRGDLFILLKWLLDEKKYIYIVIGMWTPGGGVGLFNWLLCVGAAQVDVFSGILGIVQGIFSLKFGLLQGMLFE